MKTQSIQKTLPFHPLGRRSISSSIDDGQITSDGGGLLLRETERITGDVKNDQSSIRSI